MGVYKDGSRALVLGQEVMILSSFFDDTTGGRLYRVKADGDRSSRYVREKIVQPVKAVVRG